MVELLQTTWSAIAGTRNDGVDAPTHLRAALESAVRGGAEADTMPALPNHLFRALHCWPGLRARDIIGLSTALASRAQAAGRWPAVERMDCGQWDGAQDTPAVPYPDDPGVLLGPAGCLSSADHESVVSLCRVGPLE